MAMTSSGEAARQKSSGPLACRSRHELSNLEPWRAMCHHGGMKRKQVQFTERQIVAIRRAARRRKTSDAAVIRQAVDSLLGGAQTRGIRSQQAARALEVVGRFASGRRTVSRDHDRELADAFGR